MIGGAAALATMPGAVFAAADPVERAMAAMGGRALLQSVRAISWTGTAKILDGKTPQDFGVETRIEPFSRARSQTWPLSEGRAAMRTVMIERDGGFEVVNGAQTPLPPERARYEREQFAAYAYMLLAGTNLTANGRTGVEGQRAGYPPIRFRLAPDGRLTGAEYSAAPSDPAGKPLAEHFAFSGSITATGLKWPRKIMITRDNRLYLSLTIDDLGIETR